jgi:hypothetical protein
MQNLRLWRDCLRKASVRSCTEKRHNPPPSSQHPMILRHSFIPVNNKRLARLCGVNDEHLRRLEEALNVNIAHPALGSFLPFASLIPKRALLLAL